MGAERRRAFAQMRLPAEIPVPSGGEA
jgi:hypothetical protein